MGWFGKVFGGYTGFLVGGPIGAIIGGAIGHKIDKKREEKRFVEDELSQIEREQMLFVTATFSLLGKLSKADGRVTKEEISTVESFIDNTLMLDLASKKLAIDIFQIARDSQVSFSEYAEQFYSISKYNNDRLVLIVDLLVRVAMSDNEYHPSEEKMILQAVNIFGMSKNIYDEIKGQYLDDNNNYFAILGCTKEDSIDVIKKKYHKIIAEFHPDKIISKGLPEEFLNLATEKVQEANEAYEKVMEIKEISKKRENKKADGNKQNTNTKRESHEKDIKNNNYYKNKKANNYQ